MTDLIINIKRLIDLHLEPIKLGEKLLKILDLDMLNFEYLLLLQAQFKNSKQIFRIPHAQIDELPKTLACFISFTQKFSVMGRTEISVSTLHHRNFCIPHHSNF